MIIDHPFIGQKSINLTVSTIKNGKGRSFRSSSFSKYPALSPLKYIRASVTAQEGTYKPMNTDELVHRHVGN